MICERQLKQVEAEMTSSVCPASNSLIKSVQRFGDADNAIQIDDDRMPYYNPDRDNFSCHDPKIMPPEDSSAMRSLPKSSSLPSTTSLIPISTSTIPPENNGPTCELANERQTLLLMLLGQVCSLHDATPRTFVVHVVALYERGILDSHSIRFLFDLGLIPKGFGLSPSGSQAMGGIDNEGKMDPFFSTTSWCEENEDNLTNCFKEDTDVLNAEYEQGAIVPFSDTKQQPRDLDITVLPPPSSTGDSCSSQYETAHYSNLHSMNMARRQKEALAIRKHLELHESSSSFGSSNKSAGGATSTSSSSTTFKNLSRANSSTTQNTFENSSFRHSSDDSPNISTQLATQHMPPVSSWSVEHHPLSLSRYQREFHQLSLLATGSFGSVYHAIHKLEQRPYAVKCVTFSTRGYYAETLSLVMREVRCLAQLSHPNCVRYYTSWLEPSWMTGEQKESFHNDDDMGVGELAVKANERGPKLLEEIERVIEGLHNTEINTSVEQFDSILYKDMDDGFNWASSPERSSSYFAVKECDKSPKYEPTKDPSNSRSDGSDGNDSDVSEWTQDFNREGSNRSERNSFHKSQAKCYARSESVELIRADASDRCHRPYMKQTSSSSATAYKYQISLYIQMQLCNSSTLADWIQHRNRNCIDFDAPSAFAICGQIVNGLAHVHAKGIIHRDLKPANIFAGDDGMFMIGDFGLSKMMDVNNHHGVDIDLHTNAMILSTGYSNDIHTSGVGTASYASPEQIESKIYGPAADVFSLGLIILELFSNFTSEHERAKAFLACRRDGELEPGLKHYFPEVAVLILACTNNDCSRRPSAREIQAEFQDRSGDEVFRAEFRTLKTEVANKDKLIQSQLEQMRVKDKIIEHLQKRLAALETSMDAIAARDSADDDIARN